MSRIPGALESILHQPPRNSLYLVTDVLAASANWVLLRYLYAVFAREASSRRQRLTGSEHDVDSVPFADHAETSNSDAEGQTAVVFVSWMQDYDFWKTEAKRVVGLNLDQLRQKCLFDYIDGLSDPLLQDAQPRAGAKGPSRSFTPPPTSSPRGAANASNPKQRVTQEPELAQIEAKIQSYITEVKDAHPSSHVLLILDSPSLLLSLLPSVTASTLLQSLMRLRSSVHSTVITSQVDRPFVQPAASAADNVYDNIAPSSVPTSVETQSAAFLMGCVHQASCVLSCRRLGTGFAEDVSGVIRATRGGGFEVDEDNETAGRASEEKEGEWLYYVGSDGAVKVWGRGERT